jgi:hypothetical protein
MNYDPKAGCFFLLVEDDEGLETEHRIPSTTTERRTCVAAIT